MVFLAFNFRKYFIHLKMHFYVILFYRLVHRWRVAHGRVRRLLLVCPRPASSRQVPAHDPLGRRPAAVRARSRVPTHHFHSFQPGLSRQKKNEKIIFKK